MNILNIKEYMKKIASSLIYFKKLGIKKRRSINQTAQTIKELPPTTFSLPITAVSAFSLFIGEDRLENIHSGLLKN